MCLFLNNSHKNKMEIIKKIPKVRTRNFFANYSLCQFFSCVCLWSLFVTSNSGIFVAANLSTLDLTSLELPLSTQHLSEQLLDANIKIIIKPKLFSHNNNSNNDSLSFIIKPTFSAKNCDNRTEQLPIVENRIINNNISSRNLTEQMLISYRDFNFGQHTEAYLCAKLNDTSDELSHLGESSIIYSR